MSCRTPPRAAGAAVLAVVLGLAAGSCAANRSPSADRAQGAAAVEAAVVAEPTIGGQEALVLGNPSGPRQPLVVLLHGAGGSRLTLVGERVLPFAQELVDRGYLVASSDAHGTVWGTDSSRRDYRQLYRWVAERYDVGPVVLVSESMGGVAGLQMVAADAVPRIAGWIGVSPVTDLQWAADDPQLSGSVREALTEEDVRRLDPMRIPPERFADEQLVMFVSGEDTVVPPRHGREFAAHLRPVADVELRSCPDGHASAACYVPDAVDALLE